MLNQVQTTVPLLISNSSAAGAVISGGGVSPSSTSSGSASRCTRIHNPEYIHHGHDLNGRHSSSADEGFTSGSSPVNGIAGPMALLSPQSSADTTHLVSLSSASSASSSSSSST